MQETWLWWSSGKDSAWALNELRRSGAHRVTRLLTTMNGEFDRIAMHAVRGSLLTQQAEALGLPVERISLPHPCTNAEYAAAVRPVLDAAAAAGVACMAFGDLFLEDVRRYRVELLQAHPIEPIFPIWGRDTRELATKMVASGLRAVVTCIDPRVVSRDLVGQPFGREFLDALPAGVDPCGENGEFHTFATAGPMFRRPVAVAVGEVVERDGFVFADLTHPTG